MLEKEQNGDHRNQWTTWDFVGGVSAISGLACFPLSSTYKMSFGKLGIRGLLSYLLVCLIAGCLILLARRIPVPEKVKGVVGAIFLCVICLISVVLDKYVPGKSDAFTIISYGSFALMSVSLSRKLELGFETGFSAFFLQLFAARLFKAKWFLLPIALVFCSLVIILRHYCSESRARSGSSNNEQNNQEESCKAESSYSSEQPHVSLEISETRESPQSIRRMRTTMRMIRASQKWRRAKESRRMKIEQHIA